MRTAIRAAPAAYVFRTGCVVNHSIRTSNGTIRSHCPIRVRVVGVVGIPALPPRAAISRPRRAAPLGGQMATRHALVRCAAGASSEVPPPKPRAARVTRAAATARGTGAAVYAQGYVSDPYGVSGKPGLPSLSPDEDEEGSQFSWTTALTLAAVVAAATAFAYADLSPLVGAATADTLAPAQDVIRAAVAAGKTGGGKVADVAVELALDAYEVAGVGVGKLGELLSTAIGQATSGASGAAHAAGPAMSKVAAAAGDTPLTTFAEKVRDGAAYVVDAAQRGNWAAILCAKPFQSVATVVLTVLRYGTGCWLRGVEYVCAVLFATPAYVAVGALVLALLSSAVVRAVGAPRIKGTETGLIDVPSPPPPAPTVSFSAAAAARATSTTKAQAGAATKVITPELKVPMAQEQEAREEPQEEADEEAEVKPLPASAVMRASTRVMTEREQSVMMSRVEEARSQIEAVGAPPFRDRPPPVSALAPIPAPAPAPVLSYSPPSTTAVDQSEVDRYYNELTSRFKAGGISASSLYASTTTSSSSSSSSFTASSFSSSSVASLPTVPSTPSPSTSSSSYLPPALPSSSRPPSSFNAEEYLANFAADADLAPPDLAPTPAAAIDTAPAPAAAVATAPAPTPADALPAAFTPTPEPPIPEPLAPIPTPSTLITPTPSASSSSSISFAKVTSAVDSKTVGGRASVPAGRRTLGSIGGKALEKGAPLLAEALRMGKAAWQETLELAVVVVPAVPKLLKGASQDLFQRGGETGGSSSTGGEAAREQEGGTITATEAEVEAGTSAETGGEVTRTTVIEVEDTLDEVFSGTIIKKRTSVGE